LQTSYSVADDAWDHFVARHVHGHVLQTRPWGALKSDFGWSSERVALEGQRGLVAGAQLLCRRLPGGFGCLAYVPKGPLVEWDDRMQVEQLTVALDQAAKSRGAIVLTVEPDLAEAAANRQQLLSLGFRESAFRAIQPRSTLVVNLTPSEEDILLAMKSKTRYNIRLAGRKGVAVREGDKEDIAAFNALLAATADRSDFGIHPPGYYEAAFRLFAPRGWVRLLLAEVESEPVAGIIVFALPPHAFYFYGASSNAHREKMAPYLLQWEAMRWAKSIGCTSYDLWGIPDADYETLEAQFTERSDGLWGVYRFKRGFGGDLVRSVGAWDRVYAPLRYRLIKWAMVLQTRMAEFGP